MNVLVVGYGKIGSIKAEIWKSLNAVVYVYDKNPSLKVKIINDGFVFFDPKSVLFDIVDISTPADSHFRSLEWAINTTKSNIFLVEKPLASSADEIKDFKDLINKIPELENKVFVNESYYQSDLIKKVVYDIEFRGSNIEDIEIELSKNRLRDYENGRFFDKNLESIGIEAPHMIAIIESLGLDFPRYHKSTIISDDSFVNQGFILQTVNTRPSMILKSYLGDFRLQNGTLSKNNAITRKMSIETNGARYELEFDPVSNRERFVGKLKIIINGKIFKEEILFDNHLRNHISLFIKGDYTKYKHFIGINNAIRISDELLNLRKQCNKENLHDYVNDSNNRQKENLYGTRN